MAHYRFMPNKNFLMILGTVIIAFIALEFTSPAIDNKPPEGEISVPPSVSAILKRSCYDCHSNQSNPTWYDRLAPAAHLVAHDVSEGRSRFNFSEWNKIPPTAQQVLLWEMVNAIEQKKMPLGRYLTVHPGAAVSTSELSVLKDYVNTLPGRSKVDTARIIKAANVLSEKRSFPGKQPISLTGIPYSEDYKSWKVLSVTDKFDGGSMRVVYGNEIMIKAVENKQLPFPDGAQMVKVVWGKQTEDAEGNVLPGNFQNVQFMIKNSEKYRSTKGWGFARFDGLDLKPFGNTVAFANTCINCHKLLVEKNDFVFNIPTK